MRAFRVSYVVTGMACGCYLATREGAEDFKARVLAGGATDVALEETEVSEDDSLATALQEELAKRSAMSRDALAPNR